MKKKRNIEKIYYWIDVIKTTRLRSITFVMLLVILISAIGGYYFEERINDLFEGIYWAVVTIATVGYGDISPVTVPGRLVSIGLIFSGMVILALFSGTISSILVEKRIREGQGLSSVNFKKHIIIAGWNWNAENLLEILFKNLDDTEIVMVNDLKPEEATIVLDKFKKYDLRFIHGDFTNLQVLERAAVADSKYVMILPDSSFGLKQNIDEKTIFAVMTIKAVSEKIKVYAQLLDKDKIPYLDRAKADGYFLSDKHMPYFMAANILSPGLNDVLDSLLNYENNTLLQIVDIPDEFVGKSFGELSCYYRKESCSILIALVQLYDVLKMKNIDSKDTTSIDAFIKRKFEEAGRLVKDLSKKKIVINPADDYLIAENEHAVVITCKK